VIGSSRTAGGALCLLLAGQGIGGAPAFADDRPTQVTVLRPTGGDAALMEVATRAWAELNAGGIAAVLVDCPAGMQPCPATVSPPAERVIGLTTFRRSGETITEVALTLAGHDRPSMRRSLTISDEATPDPKVMAIRAVELVNAMLLEDSFIAPQLRDDESPGHHVRGAIRPDRSPGRELKDQLRGNAAAGRRVQRAPPVVGNAPWSVQPNRTRIRQP
jgi:hypothetical protein